MDDSQLTRALDACIDENAFSGVISIRQRGAVRYERAAGYADRSSQIANTLATRFGIASGTKFLTALAIGQLVAAGKLTFDTRLYDCAALDAPRYAPEITIRHLLTHTSGIPDYFDEEQVASVDTFTPSRPCYTLRGPRDYLAMFPDAPMKFAPGTGFAYSNSGYILLGVVIEELAGARYQDVVEQAIFQPIGMRRSGFFALDRLPEQTALGYVKDAQGWRTNIYNLPIVGASDGGAFTTAQDLATLWQAFWSGAIVPAALVELFARPHVQVTGAQRPTAYGHGLWLREDARGGHEVYITGYDAGVSFQSIVSRDGELLVTVIANTTSGAWPVLRAIEAALAGERG